MPSKGKSKRGGKNKTTSSPKNKNKRQTRKNREHNENDDVGQQSKAGGNYFNPHDSGEISSKKEKRKMRKEKQKHDTNHKQQSFGSTINSGEVYLGQFDATNSIGKNDENEVTIHR